jgi:lipid-A-disaccharide synthase
MQNEGMELVENFAQKLPIIGISQVIRHYPRIKQLLKEAADMLEQRRPDLLVLVDYPGFNLRTAKVAKRLGIPVVYYISPQIWAWHKSRIKIVAENITRMLVILPFEEKFYHDANVPATFVGHPLQDDTTVLRPRDEVRQELGITPDQKLIYLVPGSRRGEIARHLTVLLEAAKLIRAQVPEATFVLPRAASIAPELIGEPLSQYPELPVRVIENDVKSIRAAADFAICKSGTSTLELALLGVPMVIIYKVSLLTYIIGKGLLRIGNIGLVNIVAGRTIVPELQQYAANPRTIAKTVLSILQDPKRLAQMRADLNHVRQSVGGPGASIKVAQEIAALLPEA